MKAIIACLLALGGSVAWAQPPLPAGPLGDAIRLGEKLFNDTPTYAKGYSGNPLSCSSCHLDGGRAPNASPMTGLWGAFPAYLPRIGRVGTLEDRINGCFLRSMNGRPLPLDSPEMRGMLAYIWWLSQGAPVGGRIPIRGNPPLAAAAPPDPVHGQAVYAQACAPCHGDDGQGSDAAPPLWGPRSFNLGAGMARTSKAAAFVAADMNGLGGSAPLAVQDAWDVSAWFTHQPRPDFAGKIHDWPAGGKPGDSRY